MRRRQTIAGSGTVTVLAGLMIAVSACGTTAADNDMALPTDDGTGSLMVTTGIWADVVANMLCLEAGAVAPIMPSGTDPHAYQPSITVSEAVSTATMVIANGAGLEEGLEPILEAAEEDGVEVVETAALVTDQVVDGDPHVWLDPVLVADVVDGLAPRLAAAGFDPATVERCAGAYRSELLALDEEIREMVATIPAEQRKLVTNHDALGYYAERYGFEVVGTVLPSTSSLAQASPAELEDLADRIEAEKIPAIFTEGGQRADEADAMAERLGVDIVELQTTILDDEADYGTYVDLMRSDTSLIVDALGGTR